MAIAFRKRTPASAATSMVTPSEEGAAESVGLRQQLADAHADAAAVCRVMEAVARATTTEDAALLALDAVREAFGWVYGSFWRIGDAGTLRFAVESGSAGPAFAEVTRGASFAEGVGLSGRAWRARDLVFVADLGEVSDCVRAPVAQQAGVRSGVCFPVLIDGRVVATMDFFSLEVLDPSPQRLEILRNVGRLVSSALERLAHDERAAEAVADSDAMTRVLGALAEATTTEDAALLALDAVREAFGWVYGSFWRIGDAGTLRFAVESGSAGPAFAEVTRGASFAEGVGLSGRAWRDRDLVFVADLGEVSDCVRAPVAQQAGVRSGVCFPVLIEGRVVGTMDFFSLEVLAPSPQRLDVLRNVGRLVSSAMSRISVAEAQAGRADAVLLATRAAAGDAAEVHVAMGRLAESSQHIGAVLDLISSIASQTKLLALNATIEAARAGDAGRGFGVVANEVKQLAAATADATSNVGKLVSSIQAEAAMAGSAIAQLDRVITEINQAQF